MADIISERQLTSYMNNAKWKEFLHTIDEEKNFIRFMDINNRDGMKKQL